LVRSSLYLLRRGARMRMDVLCRCLAMRRDIGVDVFGGGGAGAGPLDVCAHIPPSLCAWYGRAKVKRGAGRREGERLRVILDLRRGFAGLRFGSGQRSRAVRRRGARIDGANCVRPSSPSRDLSSITPACPCGPGSYSSRPSFFALAGLPLLPPAECAGLFLPFSFRFSPPSSSTKR
jgi:hypothetical protein